MYSILLPCLLTILDCFGRYDGCGTIFKKSSKPLKLLFEMEAELATVQSDDLDYERYWDKTNSIHLKKYMIEKYHSILPDVLIEKAFEVDTEAIIESFLFSSPNFNA